MFIYYKLFKNDYCRHKLINLKTTTDNALLGLNSIFAISKIHFMHIFDFLTLRRLMSYIYMEHPFLMFLDHTQRRSTVGRTPLDE